MSLLPFFSHCSISCSSAYVVKASERFKQQFQHCLQENSFRGLLRPVPFFLLKYNIPISQTYPFLKVISAFLYYSIVRLISLWRDLKKAAFKLTHSIRFPSSSQHVSGFHRDAHNTSEQTSQRYFNN
jgi:hypothetical protein